jgi:hypothetical protein
MKELHSRADWRKFLFELVRLLPEGEIKCSCP